LAGLQVVAGYSSESGFLTAHRCLCCHRNAQ